jgi:ABC-type transport system involved in multi-copper enzyme maturation permease subunit
VSDDPSAPAEPTPEPRPGFGILPVATLAFRESARNRVLHALVLAMLVVAGASYLLAWVSGGDCDVVRRHKIVADLSLSAITLLGTIASIFLGTNLVYQEVERRTIYTILARPIGRAGFIVGKYLGLVAVMAAAVLAMGLGFLVIYGLGGGKPTVALLLAILYILVELAVVIAIALLFSVAAHPIEGAVFAFVVALAGHSTGSLNDLTAELLSNGGQAPTALQLVGEKLLYVIYVLFPNLENFNLRGAAVYDLPLEPARLGWALLYAAIYVTITLTLASLVFRRRVL